MSPCKVTSHAPRGATARSLLRETVEVELSSNPSQNHPRRGSSTMGEKSERRRSNRERERERQREKERGREGSRGIDAGLEEIIRGGASAFVNVSRGIGFSDACVRARRGVRTAEQPSARDAEGAAIQQPPRIRGSRPSTRAPLMCSLAYHMRDADGGARGG